MTQQQTMARRGVPAAISTRRSGDGGAAGFTLIELLITVAIIGILLSIGVPRMATWVGATKAGAVSEFYAEGLSLARQQAIKHNAASRIVLSPNGDNGQMDWQVDLCFPTLTTPCSAISGTWSTTSAPAAGDPEGANGYTSVLRSATTLPRPDVIAVTMLPAGSYSTYYTALGWLDTDFNANLNHLELRPGPNYVNDIRSSDVVVSLAGMAIKCDPAVPVSDSRACPP